MEPSTAESIRRRISFLKANRDRLTADSDTHITNIDALSGSILNRYRDEDNYYHGRPISAEDLLREMEQAGVDVSLVWQNPAATPYTEDLDVNYSRLLQANRYIHDAARDHPEKFIPAGWTDPKALGVERALKVVETCVRDFGFPIVKMNPAQNAYPIDSDMVFEVVDRIVALGAIPAFHYGADTEFTPASGLERVAERHPEHPIIAVHMGGGGAGYVEAEELYHQSRDLGLRRPNIHYALSAKRDTHIQSDLITYQLSGAPQARNISCASDAPYGLQAFNFGGYRLLFDALRDGNRHPDARLRAQPDLFDDEAVQNYLGRNFVDLALRGYDLMLAATDRTEALSAAGTPSS